MPIDNAGAVAADERAQVAALLARFPDLDETEIAHIRNWFDRVASPLDLGTLAGDPAIAQQYRAFRAMHIDPLGARDLGKAAVWVAGLSVLALAIAFLAP